MITESVKTILGEDLSNQVEAALKLSLIHI